MCCAERTTRGNVSVVPFSIAATENACCAVFSYPSLLHSELTWIHRQQAAGFFFLLFLALFFDCQEHARLGPGPWQEIDCCMQPAVRVYRSIIDISSCACGLFFFFDTLSMPTLGSSRQISSFAVSCCPKFMFTPASASFSNCHRKCSVSNRRFVIFFWLIYSAICDHGNANAPLGHWFRASPDHGVSESRSPIPPRQQRRGQRTAGQRSHAHKQI